MAQHHTNAPPTGAPFAPTCRPSGGTCARYFDDCAPPAGWCHTNAPMTVAALGSRLEAPGSVWTRHGAGPASPSPDAPVRSCLLVRGAR